MNNLLILLDQWQFCVLLETFVAVSEIFSIFVVTAGEILLKPRQGCILQCPRGLILPDKELCYKVSLMLTLGNFNLNHYLSFIRYLRFFMKCLILSA